ncbi:hypothetical protein EMCRGX_G009184 [Ephydatia muelleri]
MNLPTLAELQSVTLDGEVVSIVTELAVATSPCTLLRCRTRIITKKRTPITTQESNMYDLIFDVAHARRTGRSHSFPLLLQQPRCCTSGESIGVLVQDSRSMLYLEM